MTKPLISNREYLTAYKFSLLAGAVFIYSPTGKEIINRDIRKLNAVSRAIAKKILGGNIIEDNKDQEMWHKDIEIPQYFIDSYNEKLKYYKILKNFMNINVVNLILKNYNLDFSAEKLSENCIILNIFDNSTYNFVRIKLKTEDSFSGIVSNITENYIYVRGIMSEKIVAYIESNFKSALKEC
mgnify:FL=1